MATFTDNLNRSSNHFWHKWTTFKDEHGLSDYSPSTVAFKTKDVNEFNQILGSLLKDGLVTQCHIGFVDKRYIASMVFHKPIYMDIRILKLMQRRPNSTDPVGLDHLDFYVKNLRTVESEFKEKNLSNWGPESNEVHSWISLRFDNTEAKFVDHLVLDVGVLELRGITEKLGYKPIEIDPL